LQLLAGGAAALGAYMWYRHQREKNVLDKGEERRGG
jgi:hypothetical protein